MPITFAGLCSGASSDSRSISATTSSVISVGAVEQLAAVHDPVPDRGEPAVARSMPGSASTLMDQPHTARRA